MDEDVKKYIKHIVSLCEIKCNVFDVRLRAFECPQEYCNKCNLACDYANTHLYGCYEAQRWGGKYIYYCPKGFIFIAVCSINDLDMIDYGVVAGPIMMGEQDDFTPEVGVPILGTRKVNDITEIMTGLFAKNSRNELEYSHIQAEAFLNDIYKIVDEYLPTEGTKYPIEIEKELQAAIIRGDVATSRELLNKLLGHIFFSSDSDLKKIKSRVLELIVLLSRSAIEGGGSIDEIFALNNDYIKAVEEFENIEKLSLWLTGVLNRFISYVFEFSDVKHTDIIYKVTSYIRDNYMKKITLEDVSAHVYLSRSYLSKIFKEEMNTGLSAYTNSIRIDKAKTLLTSDNLSLVDIANIIGFEDQSYFNKVFKNITGISPRKYREKHLKKI